MAATPTRRNADPDRPAEAGGNVRPPTVLVAYSGGRDSTALLHACARVATELGVRTVAVHVHHGLQPQADAWLERARRTCRRWAARGLDLHFEAVRLQASPPPGASLEAWARRERYQALTRCAHHHGASLVLLAHHAQDQAETVLLQMLRRSGLGAWSAMPREFRREGLSWARPWLETDPAAIERYARAHRLAWVEDPSNADPRHDRSRLRVAVWPALQAAFPEAQDALHQVARSARDAQAALDELAARDLEACAEVPTVVAERALAGEAGLWVGAPPESLPDRGSVPELRLSDWQALSPVRARGVLVHWLTEGLGRRPPATLVERLMNEALQGAGSAVWPACAGRIVRRYRGRLRVDDASTEPGPTDGGRPRANELVVRAPGRYACPGWGGAWRVEPVAQGGVPAGTHRWCLKERLGGEQFQQGPDRPARSLKKQFQSLDIPAWSRGGPLLWRGGDLVAVPGLGVDARQWATPGNEQWRLVWEPEPST